MATANNTNQAPAQTAPRATPRSPEPVLGIDVNHCKTPSCDNFGVPIAATATRGPGAANAYTIVAYGKGIPSARCNACGEHFVIKSNLGIQEEAYRILSGTWPADSCPDPMCSSHRIPTHVPKAYQSFGTTGIGSKRYRCKACGKTFSVKPEGINPIARQKQSDKNRMIMSMLVNKVPMRRICEVADVHPMVLYERIDFLHEQAGAFLASRESRIPDLDIKRVYVGVDRQDVVANWTQRSDKRNVTISSVAAGDNKTGYLFAIQPNYDPGMDPCAIEADHKARGDDLVGIPHRRHARLWLESDYAEAVLNSRRAVPAGNLASDIATGYANALARDDIEASEVMDSHDDRLPERGMLVHSEYTLHGFFVHLRKLFDNVEKVRFFLDQDSGMRAACLSAFADRIKEHRCDAFYVRIAKDLTVDEKRNRMKDVKREFAEYAKAYPQIADDEDMVKLMMLKDRIALAQEIGPWKDRWVSHPLPSLSEPEKAACHLTDLGQYDPEHLAWLYNKASLHAVDSFFNRMRRRSSMLERPINSAANRGRVWNAYGAYRPEQIHKIQTLIRACHNYVWIPEDKDKAKRGTPAMKLGLAKAPLDLNDIIYFK
jgi:transposase-like protein